MWLDGAQSDFDDQSAIHQIKICNTNPQQFLEALVHTGSTDSFISTRFCKEHHWVFNKLPYAIPLYMFDVRPSTPLKYITASRVAQCTEHHQTLYPKFESASQRICRPKIPMRPRHSQQPILATSHGSGQSQHAYRGNAFLLLEDLR